MDRHKEVDIELSCLVCPHCSTSKGLNASPFTEKSNPRYPDHNWFQSRTYRNPIFLLFKYLVDTLHVYLFTSTPFKCIYSKTPRHTILVQFPVCIESAWLYMYCLCVIIAHCIWTGVFPRQVSMQLLPRRIVLMTNNFSRSRIF